MVVQWKLDKQWGLNMFKQQTRCFNHLKLKNPQLKLAGWKVRSCKGKCIELVEFPRSDSQKTSVNEEADWIYI